MVGSTSWLKLNTKQDFTNNMAIRIANNEEDPLIDFRNIYENRFGWFTVMDDVETEVEDPITNQMVVQTTQVPHTVESVEAGITDDTHRVIMSGTEEAPEFIQQELRFDSGSLLALKGFTEAELESILGL